MKTGSLRVRVMLITTALLAIVLAVVVTAVTLAYRAKLDGDLHSRLAGASAAFERAGSAPRLKLLIPGLALEGIAVRFGGSTQAKSSTGAPIRPSVRAKSASPIHAQGPLLVVNAVLADGTPVHFSASRASIDHSVTNLLVVEILVSAAALALATGLVFHATRTALRPLHDVVETATRIARGDTRLRLEPSRTDTELGRLAQAFDRMLDALENAIDGARASDAATRRFLADASHELRTPIAAVHASVETLLREQPERPERDRLEAAVARDSERLGRLVDDLLGLARLEARPNRTPIELAGIVAPLIEDARARAPHAMISLSAEGDTTVYGDPDALQGVLRNLVDNALAAIAPEGSIDVRLGRHDGYVEALVVDDGPGVPGHERQRIFERFVRLDPSKEGHGLGLAIARRIAQQHNGELTCEPTLSGAAFTLRLPV